MLHPFALVFALVFALGPGGLFAQEQPPAEPEPIHWALASLFGTGWYTIDGNREVYVLRAPMRLTLRETEFGGETGSKTGIDFHFPATLGYHRVDEIGDFLEPENFSTLSITPGVEFEIPVTRDFWLRPFVMAGYGAGGTDTEEVWLLNAGVKSRYRIERDRGNWDLLANLYWAGYREITGDRSDGLGGLLLGVERQGLFELGNYEANVHLSYTHLGRALEYVAPVGPRRELKSLDDFLTIGFAFAPKGRQFDFVLYRPYQLGIAFEFDPDGDYFAVKFNSRSWFTR